MISREITGTRWSDAQRDAAHACIVSQRAEGWMDPRARRLRRSGLLGRPHGPAGAETAGLRHRAGRIDVVVVYKIDRLTRSLTDLLRALWAVSFVSVTQQFNTTTSVYDMENEVNEREAKTVRHIFRRFGLLGSSSLLVKELRLTA